MGAYLALSTVTIRPFSFSDLSRGDGGTLSTHAFILLPATVTEQVLQSPFLQLYGTFSPSLATAGPSGEPGIASKRLPALLTRGVLSSAIASFNDFTRAICDMKPDDIMQIAISINIMHLNMIVLQL